ncbi:hypothetical protein BOX15_Mlig024441g2 [Macrostomum lignano]|uniref:Uncharacterized protein n=2 Tax=Macrostomum lignano TaxID=282301 RepID=A0A267E8D7_9PLAT|nr:hypothetical protein BOX15_Mlig024441g2 [Macrostomum lignano]
MRLLRVQGVADTEGADVLLFTRQKCRADCADSACQACRTQKLYQDRAGDPQGSVPFTPHQEYLYCLRFDKQPVTALLALTPREQDVEVQEKGVLAYWFMKWLERAKILNPTGAVDEIGSRPLGIKPVASAPAEPAPVQQAEPQPPPPPPPPPPTSLPPPPPPPPPPSEVEDPYDQLKEEAPQAEDQAPQAEDQAPQAEDQAPQAEDQAPQAEDQAPATEECPHKQTSDYLPNMQVIYQVKKDQLGVVLPKPEQLTRPIDIILISHEEGNSKVQSVTMEPGAVKSGSNLVALRNMAYTLRVQLHGLGRPVDLLDFITEQKILRVQESKDAPKQLNFLMERLIEQRGTFVLHITFDEKIVEVGTKPLGEFYLDVDVDAHRMLIGTIKSHVAKHYRVEKVLKETNSNILLADKQLVFEGGVDPDSLTIRESIPIERMSDYLITVVDPATKQTLPTSVLAFQRNALYVKEIKNSDVRLHVTVQRQPTMVSQSSNANNRRSAASPLISVDRQDPSDPSSAFHCPFRSGWNCFRIHHSACAEGDRPPLSSVGSASPAESVRDAETATAATGQLATSSTSEPVSGRRSSTAKSASFSLDVDLPALKARLLPCGEAAAAQPPRSALFIIYEESYDGKLRSTPCHLGQAFKVKHWCKYTVKCVESDCLNPLLTFCITDKEVADVRACSSSVRLSKRFVHEVV